MRLKVSRVVRLALTGKTHDGGVDELVAKRYLKLETQEIDQMSVNKDCGEYS